MRANSPAHDGRQGLDGERLGQAGQALQQAVASRQQADQEPLEGVILADHDLLHFVAGGLEEGGVPPERGVESRSSLVHRLISLRPSSPRPRPRLGTGVRRDDRRPNR